LQAISDSLGAGGVVDRVSHSAACGANDSASSLCDAAHSVTELRDSLAIVVGLCDWSLVSEDFPYQRGAGLGDALGALVVVVERHGVYLGDFLDLFFLLCCFWREFDVEPW
jgi:hypothetical protein